MTTLGWSTARRKPPHVLANTPFRKLWTAMSVCSLGDWLNLLALTALAGNLTAGSGYKVQSLAIGGVFVAKMLPAILLGPLAGAFADRFDRRMTMFFCDFLRFALVLSIPLIGNYQWVITATFLVECVNLFWVPAKDATVPNLVPKERLEEANQLNLLVTYGTAPIAALLFAVLSVADDALGNLVPFFAQRETYLALFINALAYLVSAFIILSLKDIPKAGARAATSTPSVLRQIFEGWRFVGGNRLIRGLIIGMLGAFAAGGAVVGVAKIYVDALGGGDAAYGVVFGAVFVGMASGMFFGPRLLRELSRRRLFGLSIVVAGVVLVAIALVPNLVIVVLLTVLLGACAGIAWIIGYTMIGLEVDDNLRGRTFSFLQSLARVTLLLVVAVAPTLAGLFGEREIRVRAGAGLPVRRLQPGAAGRRPARGDRRDRRATADGRPQGHLDHRRPDRRGARRAVRPREQRAGARDVHRVRGRRGRRARPPSPGCWRSGCATRASTSCRPESRARPRWACGCARSCSTRCTRGCPRGPRPCCTRPTGPSTWRR